MPNAPRTPKRGIRVPDAQWQAMKAAAARRGDTVTAVVLWAFDMYLLLPNGMWREVQEKARREGVTVQSLVLRAFDDFLRS